MKALMGVSGGTAASMGAFMKYFTYERGDGDSVFVVPEFWRGMILNYSPELLGKCKVKDWDKFGGSPYVPSCKNTNVFRFQDRNCSKDIIEYVKDFDVVISIGGDGTTKQADEMSWLGDGFKSITVAATMDNDFPCFDNTLGFSTAVENMAESILATYCDAMTMQRPMIIYSMGYNCGRVAACATQRAIDLGAKIDMLHLPEFGHTVDDIANIIQKDYHKGAYVLVVSEGCCKSEAVVKGNHQTYDYGAYTKALKEKTGIEFKAIIGDYRQRSGIPTQSDKALARKFAIRAYSLCVSKQYNRVIGSVQGKVVDLPLDEVAEMLRSKPKKDWYADMDLDAIKDIIK